MQEYSVSSDGQWHSVTQHREIYQTVEPQWIPTECSHAACQKPIACRECHCCCWHCPCRGPYEQAKQLGLEDFFVQEEKHLFKFWKELRETSRKQVTDPRRKVKIQ